jgi:hypothetical protein
MGVWNRRLTLGRLMAVIGLVALGFAMPRVDATPAVSLCVFAGCSWYLANRRYAEAMARRAAEGVSTTASRKARIAARCAVGAALAIGLPDAAFLGGYYGYMRGIFLINGTDHFRPDLEPEHILCGAVVGIAAALYVAAIMRRGRRPAAKKRIAKPADRTASHRLLDNRRVAARRVSAC